MTYDLPKAKGSIPLPFAALATVITLVIGIQIIIFDGNRQSRANADEVIRLQDTIPAPPDLCAGARPRC